MGFFCGLYRDVRISIDMLKQISEVYRKIRNTMRFLHGNLATSIQKQIVLLMRTYVK